MQPVRVLVVEDVPELSRLLEITFELDDRFTPVGTATTGGTALDLAARHQPDAVVLDIGLGGLDGVEILPIMRALVPGARIIVFTGRDDAQTRERALSAGAAAWLLKGGDLGALLDELAKGLPLAERL